MKKLCAFFCGIGLVLNACTAGEQNEEKDGRMISKKHATLLGEWQEKDSTATLWKFELDEVKWKGFTHMYQLLGDTLTISGMEYHVAKQTEKELVLVNPSGIRNELTRKE